MLNLTINQLRPRIDPECPKNQPIARFKRGVVGDSAGIFTSNWEEAKKLKAEGKQVILGLRGDYEPKWMYEFRGMDGIIVEGKSSNHLAIMLQNHSIPAVLGMESGEWPSDGQPITLHMRELGRNSFAGEVSLGKQKILPPDEAYFNKQRELAKNTALTTKDRYY